MVLFMMLTKGMGEPTYALLLSLIASWHSRLVQRVLHRRFFAGYLLNSRWFSAVTLSQDLLQLICSTMHVTAQWSLWQHSVYVKVPLLG